MGMELGNVFGLLAIEVAQCRVVEASGPVAVFLDGSGNMRALMAEDEGYNEALSDRDFLMLVSKATPLERIAERLRARLEVA